MNCEEWFERLYEYLDKELDEIAWKDVEAHMHGCRSCGDRYTLEIRIRERLRESCNREECTEQLKVRIQAILDKY